MNLNIRKTVSLFLTAVFLFVGCPSGIAAEASGDLSAAVEVSAANAPLSVTNVYFSQKQLRSGQPLSATAYLLNTGNIAVEGTMILALYQADGSLHSIVVEPFAAPPASQSEASAAIPLPAQADGMTAKCFLWDKNQIPLWDATVPNNVKMVNENSTNETKSMYLYLKDQPNKIMFGHQTDETGLISGSDTVRAVGDRPTVLATSVGASVDSIRNAYASGQIISAEHHVNIQAGFGRGYGNTTEGDMAWGHRLVPGQSYHANLVHYLRSIVAPWVRSLTVSETDDTLIPIIYRPWHEHNGDWFWWDTQNTTEGEMKEIFRFTVEYLRDVEGLTNIIYAFSPNGHFESEEEYLYAYPGDEYIDLLGIDIYCDVPESNPDWFDLMIRDCRIAVHYANKTGKAAALTECGLRWNTKDGFEPLGTHEGNGKAKGEAGLQTKVLSDAQRTWYTTMANRILQDDLANQIAYMSVWRQGMDSGNLHFWVPFKDYTAPNNVQPLENRGYLGDHQALGDFVDYYNTDNVEFLSDTVDDPKYDMTVQTIPNDPYVNIKSPVKDEVLMANPPAPNPPDVIPDMNPRPSNPAQGKYRVLVYPALLAEGEAITGVTVSFAGQTLSAAKGADLNGDSDSGKPAYYYADIDITAEAVSDGRHDIAVQAETSAGRTLTDAHSVKVKNVPDAAMDSYFIDDFDAYDPTDDNRTDLERVWFRDSGAMVGLRLREAGLGDAEGFGTGNVLRLKYDTVLKTAGTITSHTPDIYWSGFYKNYTTPVDWSDADKLTLAVQSDGKPHNLAFLVTTSDGAVYQAYAKDSDLPYDRASTAPQTLSIGLSAFRRMDQNGFGRSMTRADLSAVTRFSVRMESDPGQNFAGLNAKEFYLFDALCWVRSTDDEGDNVAFRRAAYQSSAIDEFYTATLVSDGIVSEPVRRSFADGAWQAASRYYGEWIAVDLGEPTVLNTVSVDWGETYATRYKIQTSDDAVTWTTRINKGSNEYSGGGSGTPNALGTPIAPWANTVQTDAFEGVTARFVRVFCETASGLGETYQIKGIRVNEAAINDYYTPDGFDSYWQSKTGGEEWVYIDLGADTALTGVNVAWGGNFAQTYAIQVSDDEETWTTIGDAIEGAANSTVETDVSGIGRFVRILCKEAVGGNYIIKEIMVTGENDLDYGLEPMPAPEADGTQYLRGGNWKLQRATEVSADGFALSQPGYDDADWLPATVPSTTLVSYLNAGAVPDPYYDDQNLMISDAFFTADFWYRDSFEIPAEQNGKDVWLNFDAINYRADVYFNGHYLPNALDNRTRSIEGGFIRGKFDVTPYVHFGEENHLAVFIQMNDTPWSYTNTSPSGVGASTTIGAYVTRYATNQFLNAGPWPNGGNLGIDNPTFHAAAGWDWMPTIRGRDTGIYRDVFLSFADGAEIIDPWMTTDLNITEIPSEYSVTPLSVDAAATQPAGQNGTGLTAVFDGNLASEWLGDKAAQNPSFTVELPEAITVNTAVVNWGEVMPAAAYETQNARRFKLEVSNDGIDWRNFDAYPAGGEGGDAYPAFDGTPAYDGENVANIVTGPSMQGTNTGFRFFRFTALEKMTSVNSDQGIIPPKVLEIRFYAETKETLDASGIRQYTLDDSRANLTFRTAVQNNTDEGIEAVLSGVITPGDLTFEKIVPVAANTTEAVVIEDILLENPALWWPNTYGDQPLYTASVEVKTHGAVSDTAEFKFGVREFAYPIDNTRLAIYCNGTRIVAKGGNWGMDDAMQMDTPERYDDKIRLHAEENMTMIRNWVGQTYHKAFYDACDKYGIMVWDDFWLANPYDGPNPKDRAMFLENAVDKVKVVRSHASLTVYCGRNESNPTADLDNGLTSITANYDGTRLYFPNSARAPVGSGGGYSLGNYIAEGNAQGPKQYYTNVSNEVLRSERGIPNVPSIQSIRKFVAPENQWPISEVWAHHDWTYMMNGPANTYMNALKSYMPEIEWTFPNSPGGAQNQDPETQRMIDYRNQYTPMLEQLADRYTLEDFSKATQLINQENHKALYQALTVKRANGLLMWMSQSAWPSFMWQTYDYYLDTNGGYFGVKAGNQPTQAVWNPIDDSLVLSNFTPNSYADVTTELTVYDLNGKVVAKEIYETPYLASDACGVKLDTLTEKFAASPTDMIFIKLILKAEDGGVLGENTYWHNKTTYLAHQALNELADAAMTLGTVSGVTLANGNRQYTVSVTNNTDTPAVQTRIRTIADATGADILPAFYSDNYFMLMPGDSKTITVEFNPKYLESGDFSFELSGWNTVVTSVHTEQ